MNKIQEELIIENYKIVCFDIFDTLIKRTVTLPSDTFELAAKRVGIDTKSFRRDRVKAEEIARKKAQNGEVKLDQIYDELTSKYGDTAETLKEAELKVELEICRPKKSVCSFFKKCQEAGKQLFLISDMYLSEETIKEMLKKCGIENYDGLYVSNSYGVNKTDGQLFRTVISENGIDAKEMIHIGDGFRPDYLGAKSAGVKSHIIPKGKMLRRIAKKVIRKVMEK